MLVNTGCLAPVALAAVQQYLHGDVAASIVGQSMLSALVMTSLVMNMLPVYTGVQYIKQHN